MLTEGMFIDDRYEIVGKIGAGGMSDVYKAKDHTLGRFVAIKVLKQEFSEDVNFVTKFRTEAQSAAGLEHPNIVNIYDVGSQEGMYYIIMEYVEGITLKTYIEKKGQLTFKEAISIAIQVGRGIEAAHKKNIIHRDIKPQNIMISTEGKVKVMDFGIARAATSNTINSDVMGSVHYSSPEQARNGFVDGRSDIYSLGIVMYEMVTGRVPFDGDTTVAVAIQHLQEEMVAPSAYAPNLPVSLEKIILKCTQKNADRRYQTMGDLLLDLKKSLINPDEDFVTLVDPNVGGETRKYNDEDLERIKKEAESVYYDPQEEAEEDEDDEEEEEESEGELNPKMEKAMSIAGIVAGVIIVGIVIWLILSVSGIVKFGSSGKKDDTKEATKTEKDSEQVEMIDVTGMTYEEAKKALNKIDLGIKDGGTQASEKYDAGEIISQSEDEGDMIKKNTTIVVVMSSGVGEVSVPDVKGLDETSAINKLQDNGFKYSRDYANSDTVASGQVISQTPDVGAKAKKGDSISIVVSQGKAPVVVPKVVGKSETDARNELSGAGLTVTSVTKENSDTVAAGNVISQSIADGKYVDAGSNISLVISDGPKITYYKFSAKITAPADNDSVVGASIVLKDSNGAVLEQWNSIAIESFPYSIQKTDIAEMSSGKLEITWSLSDGTEQKQVQDVKFNKQ